MFKSKVVLCSIKVSVLGIFKETFTDLMCSELTHKKKMKRKSDGSHTSVCGAGFNSDQMSNAEGTRHFMLTHNNNNNNL